MHPYWVCSVLPLSETDQYGFCSFCQRNHLRFRRLRWRGTSPRNLQFWKLQRWYSIYRYHHLYSHFTAWRHVGNLNRQRAGHLVLALGESNFPIFLIFGGKNKNGEPKCEIFNPLVSRRSQEFSIPELDGRRIGASTVVLEYYP